MLKLLTASVFSQQTVLPQWQLFLAIVPSKAALLVRRLIIVYSLIHMGARHLVRSVITVAPPQAEQYLQRTVQHIAHHVTMDMN